MVPRGQSRGCHGGQGSGNTGIIYHGGPIIYNQNVAAIYWSAAPIYNGGPAPGTTGPGSADGSLVGFYMRSEERRVGKECRSRMAAYHEKKKGRKKREVKEMRINRQR